MKTFVMLVGLSGSGKSTYRTDIAEPDDVILSTDEYIEEYARLNGKTYNEVFHDQIDAAQKRFNEDFNQAIKNGKNIILDQTNLYIHARRKKLARVPKDYKKIAVVFDVKSDILKEVNESRKQIGRALPESVIQSQIDAFTMPTLEEGFDQIIVIER